MTKLPAMQFYPGDWFKDPALRSVSLESRGLWIDLLCLMFESDRRGYLQHATGAPVTNEQIARMVGCSVEQALRALQELEDCGVFSRTRDGIIYSRRMERDERERSLGRTRQDRFRKKQEALHNAGCNADVTVDVTAVSRKSNGVSSSSSSRKENISLSAPARGGPVDWHEPEYQKRRAVALDILHEVNERCGKKFPDHYAEVGVIMDRLAEGRLRDDFTRIITNKLRDPVFTGNRNLYRPRTLFAADKFETYLYENPDDYGELKNGGSGKRASRRETGQYLAPGGPYPDDTPR